MTDYYIAPTTASPAGNDSNAGTIGAPWASLSRYLDEGPQAGDTVYFRGGVITGSGNRSRYLRTAWSGTSGNPITLRNYPGETPVLDGQSSGGWLIGSRSDDLQGASWWVVDGLSFQNYGLGASLIHIGNWDDNNTDAVGNWVIRNCTVINWKNAAGSFDHCIYVSVNAANVTIEDNYFKGPYPVDGVGTGETGACLHFHHPPQNSGHVIQRNIIESWEEGIQLWNTAGLHQIGVSILHNTFLDCGKNIDARYHGDITIRDNAGESGRNYDVYDPYDSGYTTSDHNFWGQEFDSSYYLLPGETGIDAASDGTDAGALDSGGGGGGGGGGGDMPTVEFTCGAECDLSHWTTKTGAYSKDTGTKRSESASIKITAAGAAATVEWNGTAGTDWVVRFAIRFSSLPAADACLARLYSASQYNLYVGYDDATGKLCVFMQTLWANRVLGPVIEADTWYVIDIQGDYATNHTIDWKVDGAAQTQFTYGPGAGTWSRFAVGQRAESSGTPGVTTYTAFYDDIVVSYDPADYSIDDGYVVSGETWTPASDSGPVTVTPTTASLTLTTFAPTVTATANVTVTPPAASLALATFAPTVTATASVVVTPTTASLTLATFAPAVTTGLTITPGVASLLLVGYPPTVTGSRRRWRLIRRNIFGNVWGDQPLVEYYYDG